MNFIFPYFGNNIPNRLIFFRCVETTNQTTFIILCSFLHHSTPKNHRRCGMPNCFRPSFPRDIIIDSSIFKFPPIDGLSWQPGIGEIQGVSNTWMVGEMEKLEEMDDLGVPPFQETSMCNSKNSDITWECGVSYFQVSTTNHI